MAKPASKKVPTDISEVYYQIAAEVLASFPKYRPPLDLFSFKDDICVLAPYSRKGQRLTNDQVAEIQELCGAGGLFVSRSDYPVYSEHIIKQLDLVLQDENLTETEVADVCTRALIMRYEHFAEQPVKAVFEPLYRDIMVVTEWLWEDKFRIKNFFRRLFHEHTLAHHAFNSMAVGLWIWITSSDRNYRRRELDKAALAFFLHDIGMAKIPQFILTKSTRLSNEDREKINIHPLLGYKIMQKMDMAYDELNRCVMEHHERLNGSGYPQRLKSSQISEIGRICAVADAFSAMVTTRSYAPAKMMEVAAKELSNDTQRFDGKYTAMLLNAIVGGIFGEMHEISNNTSTPSA